MTKGDEIRIIAFHNQSKTDKRLLKTFIQFHHDHYHGNPQYVPLLDYEYLGFSLIGIKGFFEASNLFYKHAEMVWFLAYRENQVVGRCTAFVNHGHNQHWNDKVGFFGQFECIDDQAVADSLLNSAKTWLKERGMTAMRGPQNLPVNEATPGLMIEGYDSRPVMYYHYNKSYYTSLVTHYGLKPVKKVLSWEYNMNKPLEEKLKHLPEKIIKRYHLKLEHWGDRPLEERKHEMFIIYNDAWNDNYGFVPFTQDEFYRIVDDMMLIMVKELFTFIYVKDEPAAFVGAVPNVTEKMTVIPWCKKCELLRAIKMILGAKKTKGIRLGYLGVRKKFRRMGLDGVMLWRLRNAMAAKGYEYGDAGWVLEDNVLITRLIDLMGAQPSKTYQIYEMEFH